MQMREMKAAVNEKWRVRDDFGAEGIVTGLDPKSNDRVLVLWDGEKFPAKVHYQRAAKITQ